MLDIKWIRKHPTEFGLLLLKRGITNINAAKIIALDEERRRVITLIQQLQHIRRSKTNALSRLGPINVRALDEAKRDIGHIHEKLQELQKLSSSKELEEILDSLPNLPALEVPEGSDSNCNKLIRSWGKERISEARSHFDIGKTLGMMDFEQTSRFSGSRFVTLRSKLAKLERALVNFMLDVHTNEGGFIEVSPPYLVRDGAMYNTGQLPKFSQDSFQTTNNYRLISTAEIPLINLVANQILLPEVLPMRLVAATPCFRSEAGSAGKDTRGMIRMHQFLKVELVSITIPEQSEEEHNYLTNSAENILKKLELPYRVMLLCAGDMGFQAAKTYDLEVWLPSQKQYREISSCSNCTDFQSRRMKARYREYKSLQSTYVHTLNASGLAVGRTLAAILENYQNSDNSVTVPSVLVPYMNGMQKIEV